LPARRAIDVIDVIDVIGDVAARRSARAAQMTARRPDQAESRSRGDPKFGWSAPQPQARRIDDTASIDVIDDVVVRR